MACTPEGETWMPRLRSSRAARTLPISGRSFASASAAVLAERVTDMENYDSTTRQRRRRAAPAVQGSVVLRLVVARIGAALEVGGHVDVPAALVARELRIRTQRTRAARPRRGRRRRSQQAGGRNAVFDPIDHRREGIDRACPWTTAAVIDAGQQEEAREAPRCLEVVFAAAHGAVHVGAPVYPVLRLEWAGALRLPDQQLAAARLERRQVGGVD